MVNFISDYNYKYRPPASFNTNGICLLGDVDKGALNLEFILIMPTFPIIGMIENIIIKNIEQMSFVID